MLETDGAAMARAHQFQQQSPLERRLQFCPAEVQRKWFARQFDLARDSGLPVFLHMRAAAADLLAIVREKHASHHFSRGVIHSFDGTLEEAQSILSLQGLCIGNNL